MAAPEAIKRTFAVTRAAGDTFNLSAGTLGISVDAFGVITEVDPYVRYIPLNGPSFETLADGKVEGRLMVGQRVTRVAEHIR
eukprot:gene6724-23096_t